MNIPEQASADKRPTHVKDTQQSLFDFEQFRKALTSHMERKGATAAGLSKKAGLNARAVKDIQEGRSKNPRVQTILALEAALDLTPGTLIGITARSARSELLSLIHRLDLAQQQDLLPLLRHLAQK